MASSRLTLPVLRPPLRGASDCSHRVEKERLERLELLSHEVKAFSSKVHDIHTISSVITFAIPLMSSQHTSQFPMTSQHPSRGAPFHGRQPCRSSCSSSSSRCCCCSCCCNVSRNLVSSRAQCCPMGPVARPASLLAPRLRFPLRMHAPKPSREKKRERERKQRGNTSTGLSLS